MAELILLNRIRGDIGEYSGSVSKLFSLASFKGFNDNYEPQEKPRLVGTWTINKMAFKQQLRDVGFNPDIVTETTNLEQQSTVFDGLTIALPNISYLADFAVQTYSSNEDGYNPWFGLFMNNFSSRFLSGSVDYIEGALCATSFSPRSGGYWLDRGGQVYYNTDGILWIKDYNSITDGTNIVIDDPGKTWNIPNVIDYDELKINTPSPIILFISKRDTLVYYFPKSWIGIFTATIVRGAATGETIGAEYRYKGNLAEFFNATIGHSMGGYMNHQWNYRVPDLYIEDDNKEIGEYDASELNPYFYGKTTIDNKFMLTKAHITEIPQDTLIVSRQAFLNCANAAFELPSSITNIGEGAFTGSSIYGVVNLPNLTVLQNEDGSYYPQRGTFEGTNISEIRDLGSITSLQYQCFANCTNLTKVTLSSMITSIGSAVFANCTALSTFTILSTTPPSIQSDTFNNCSNLTHIYVPAASVSAYQSASGWSQFASIIEAIPTT